MSDQSVMIQRIKEICDEFDSRVTEVGLVVARLEFAKAIAESEASQDELARLRAELAAAQKTFDAQEFNRQRYIHALQAEIRMWKDCIVEIRASTSLEHLCRLKDALPTESNIHMAGGWGSAATILIEYIQKLTTKLAAAQASRQQAAEAGARGMKHICKSMAEDWDWRKSGDNTNLDIAIGIDEIDPAAVARAALQALDGERKTDAQGSKT